MLVESVCLAYEVIIRQSLISYVTDGPGDLEKTGVGDRSRTRHFLLIYDPTISIRNGGRNKAPVTAVVEVVSPAHGALHFLTCSDLCDFLETIIASFGKLVRKKNLVVSSLFG